jgi:autotransporter-associated beta strand protein
VNIAQPMDLNGSTFNITGGGNVVLNAASTDVGGTTIFFGSTSPNGPVLKLGVNDALPTNKNLTLGTTSTSNGADRGTLDLAGFNQTVNALNGQQGTGTTPSAASTRRITNSATGITSVLTVGNGNASSTFHGLIEDGAGKVSLVKVGTGTLTLPVAHTYTGDTTITGGTLSLAIAALADTADVNLTTASTLNLAFTGTDTIDHLRLNGLAQAPGTWGSLASTATNKTALITGTGLLNVTGTQPPYDAWALAGGLDGTPSKDASLTADTDTDGTNNLLEYATKMNPTANDVVPQSATKNGSVIDFIYTKNKSATDVTFTVEWSDDFTTWSTAGVTQALVPGSDNGVTQQWKATLPAGVNGRRFVHLNVTRP